MRVPAFLKRQIEREIRRFITDDLKLELKREGEAVVIQYRERIAGELVDRRLVMHSENDLDQAFDLFAKRLKVLLMSRAMRGQVWAFLKDNA